MRLLKLPVCGVALQVGAHPDDEDNALLAFLARGVFLDTYYLVATYGEGGQNECGPELYEALGVLRSQELEEARRIDGAHQLYMGAHDFGYSKSAAETLNKWDRDALLATTVALLRRYRPDIVLTHHDTVSGHGHHQAVGWIIQEAVTAAADPAVFPEQLDSGLAPWRVLEVYVYAPSEQATIHVNVGAYSPILGMSFCELGQISRSKHKSQGMGGPSVKGDVFRPYRMVYRDTQTAQAEPEQHLLESLDLSLAGLVDRLCGKPETLEVLRDQISRLDSIARAAVRDFSLEAPERILPHLASGLKLARHVLASARSLKLSPESLATLERRMQSKQNDFQSAIEAVCAMECEATVCSEFLTPGSTTEVVVRLWNRRSLKVAAGDFSVSMPPGWSCEPIQCQTHRSQSTGAIPQNSYVERRFRITAPFDAEITGAFSPGLAVVEFDWHLLDSGVVLTSSAYPRLVVVPPIEMTIRPEISLAPASTFPRTQVFSIRVKNNTVDAVCGEVELDLPNGIRNVDSLRFSLTKQGEETCLHVPVKIERPSDSHVYTISAQAVTGASLDQVSNTSYRLISYPHVTAKRLPRPATVKFGAFDVTWRPGLRLGYIDTGLDNVADLLEQLGISVHRLSDEDLRWAKLGEYDTIVLGIRAYFNRLKLESVNRHLLQFVYNGGTLVIQYNKSGEWNPVYAPYPLEIGRERVTAEEAPVRVLEAEHILNTTPNRLSERDWIGWVQERGLYFASSWAPEYTPIVECADLGEEPQRGAWLVAHYGAGAYIYNALSLHRQVDSLVAGGVRILANMVSYRQTGKLNRFLSH